MPERMNAREDFYAMYAYAITGKCMCTYAKVT